MAAIADTLSARILTMLLLVYELVARRRNRRRSLESFANSAPSTMQNRSTKGFSLKPSSLIETVINASESTEYVDSTVFTSQSDWQTKTD